MKTKLLLLVLFAHACFAQSLFFFGARGGLPFGEVVQSVQNDSNVFSSSDHYVVGPTLGINLPLGFSVAADALFSPVHFSADSGKISSSSLAFEFPVIARFAPGHGPLSPFVGAGVSVRHIGDLGSVGSFLTDSSSNSIEKSPAIGFVIAGGFQIKFGPVRVIPELRYTHWGSNDVSSALSNVIRLNDNEGQVLVGVTF